MGFFSKLGSKIGHAVHDYGQKAKHLVVKGVKTVAENAGAIAQAADKVGDIAGKVSSVAGVAAGVAAATGIGAPIAAGLTAVAGAAKGVQGVAGAVGRGASVVDTGVKTARAAQIAADRAKRGDIMGAIEAAKVAKAGAESTRKQIQRVRKP